MGYQDPPQENLFQYHIYLDNRVRGNHPLRKMKELIDFDFICEKVKDVYGTALKHIKKHVKFMDTKKKKTIAET